MSLSSRVSIQWLPEEPEEFSNTMVFTSLGNHYVDIRILSNQYPYPKREKDLPIDEVFQWCLSGVEEPISGTPRIAFHSSIDSQQISKAIKNGTPVQQGEPDVGTFLQYEDYRKETGKMTNPATGVVQKYVEIWKPLDINKHEPDHEAVLYESVLYEPFKGIVLEIDTNEYFAGKIVRLGHWVQGLVYDKRNKDVPLAVIRRHKDVNLIEYGNTDWFPVDFEGKQGDVIKKTPELTWICREVTFSTELE